LCGNVVKTNVVQFDNRYTGLGVDTMSLSRVETSYLNTEILKFESSQKKYRTFSADSTEASSKRGAFLCIWMCFIVLAITWDFSFANSACWRLCCFTRLMVCKN